MTLFKRLPIAATIILSILGCSDDNHSRIQGNTPDQDIESCIVQIGSFDANGASMDSAGRVTAKTSNGTSAFMVKATWSLNSASALTMREPVNQVTLEFFRPNGTAASTVNFDQFRLVMDMGGHGHTTDECPAVSPEIAVTGNKVTIKKINFVMATRTINKWFFYNFTATVDGLTGSVHRFNIPHKVQ